MDQPVQDGVGLGALERFPKFRLYQAFCDERAEILRHKWTESEKARHDIGFDGALTDWIVHHHTAWRRSCLAKFQVKNWARYSTPIQNLREDPFINPISYAVANSAAPMDFK